ncbi:MULTISPECIES: chemotaxis protein CheA [unclassified Limnobacter]|jgi:two-component system, chemotaxis family, sensor kinase CheA|uniref:chemotaxis protein CheA n=3 Tax=Limnobacter TaxID=131079 RepID=UPI000C5011E9|nr:MULTISPECIES: chemotaxis protein CheA [unclassified Limnobacter]MAG79970.1 chemotaxis protein CheA [Sutterellaceae bacterium]MBA4315001.1 chemotaxis protein CheA [Alcaligenaceae bacterium]HAV75665.1 chemotaxis protein CheA [Limnobacter sp.]|tara:strand:+ start:6686 stop:8665 length:1980 start_codon:yes stop_codon:yes gene_type:complete
MSTEIDLDSIKSVFFTEAYQLLADVENLILQLEKSPEDLELLNAAFRAIHTIKGSAGVFGFANITHFVHDLETVLDRVRNQELQFDSALGNLVLACCDQVHTLVESLESGVNAIDLDEASVAEQTKLTAQLKAYLLHEQESLESESSGEWLIQVELGLDTFRDGFDPYSIFSYLSKSGQFKSMEPQFQRIPKLGEFDPESCFLGFKALYETAQSQAEILDAFEFLPEECKVAVTSAALAHPVTEVKGSASSSSPGSVVKEPARKAKTATSTIRVQSDKLDALINLVGELVIANAGTVEQARKSQNFALLEATCAVGALIEEIRDGALGLRMVEIGECFQRFQRVVRDTAQALGKEVDLIIQGEETELDKSVVEKISDPLMHLVRNAMDHGLETPDERLKAGKKDKARLTLNAYHDGGHIVIEVGDNGRGLVHEKIRAKAIEKGIVSATQTLSESDINMLIFAPGFSTAAAVTDISGRGVGMDVVKRNIEALRGTVNVRSKEGAGTTFEIRLPLTLAIIDGFQIAVGNSVYVIPLAYVRECVELTGSGSNSDAVDLSYDLRGEYLPCIRLRKVFGETSDKPKRENIIVVSHGGMKVGIVADRLLGESQTVIKPLGGLFEGNPAVSGGTIMGNGEVALIVDIPKLVGEVGQSITRGFMAKH